MGEQGAGPAKVCRYECPLCGKRGQTLSRTADPHGETVTELRSHVRMTDDEVHGPTNSLPDDGSLADPAAHVAVEEPAD